MVMEKAIKKMSDKVNEKKTTSGLPSVRKGKTFQSAPLSAADHQTRRNAMRR